MNGAPKEAMILLYPNNYDSREVRNSLNQFCQSNDISIIDVITFSNIYDYLAAKRLYHIIKYNTKPMALVSNKELNCIMPVIALLTLLDIIGSDKALDMTLNLLQSSACRAYGSMNAKTSSNNINDFYIMHPEELRFMSEWMGDVKYEIVRGKK